MSIKKHEIKNAHTHNFCLYGVQSLFIFVVLGVDLFLRLQAQKALEAQKEKSKPTADPGVVFLFVMNTNQNM